MKRHKLIYSLALSLFFLLIAGSASAQVYVISGQVRDHQGNVIPSATVIVLSGNLNTVNTATQPGSPLATIYSDPAGTMVINQNSNPVTTNGLGQFVAYGAPGNYVIQAYRNGFQLVSPISITTNGTGCAVVGSSGDLQKNSGTGTCAAAHINDGVTLAGYLAFTNPQAFTTCSGGGPDSCTSNEIQWAYAPLCINRCATFAESPADGNLTFNREIRLLITSTDTYPGLYGCHGETSDATARCLATDVVGDIVNRFQFSIGGRMQWGPGNGAQNANLYADEATVPGTLHADGPFTVGGSLQVGNGSALTAAFGPLHVHTGANQNLVALNGAGGRLSLAALNDSNAAFVPFEYYASQHDWNIGTNLNSVMFGGPSGIAFEAVNDARTNFIPQYDYSSLRDFNVGTNLNLLVSNSGSTLTLQAVNDADSLLIPLEIASSSMELNETSLQVDSLAGGGTRCVNTDNTGLITGSACTGATLATNGVDNASQTLLNFATSTANILGIGTTPVNTSGGIEKEEIGGTPIGTWDFSGVTSMLFPPTANTTGLFYQTIQVGGTPVTQEAKTNFVAGTNMTIAPTIVGGVTTLTFTASASAATAFSAITAATNSNAGNFIVSGGNWDFSGGTWKAPIGAAYAPTTDGIFGLNSTTHLWAFGQNGVTLTLPQTLASVSHQFLTSYTGSTGAFTQAALVSGDIPNNAANTTGNAATATAAQTTPTLCSSGQAPTGVTATFNATGCTAYAHAALDNLATVAVNLALTPGTDNSIALDSLTKRYTNGWFAGVLGWTNGSGTADTGFSRDSAGVIDLGNGTGSDYSGTLKTTNIIAAASSAHQIPIAENTSDFNYVTCGANNVFTGVTSADPACLPVGVIPRGVSTNSDTIATGDRGNAVVYTYAGAVAITVPQAGSAGFANGFPVQLICQGTGATCTFTPTISTVTIVSGNAPVLTGQTFFALTTGQYASMKPDVAGTGWYVTEVTGGGGGSGGTVANCGTQFALYWAASTGTTTTCNPNILSDAGNDLKIAGTDFSVNGGLASYGGTFGTSGMVLYGVEGTGPTCKTSWDFLWLDSTDHRTKACDNNGTAFDLAESLPGTSSSIGGGALLAGACASTTVTITGAAVGMATQATPSTYPGDGNYWLSYVSASNTVTVKVCAAIAGTPTSSVYNVRLIK